MSRKTDRGIVAKLEAIYARLPRVSCRGLCSVACGPIVMSAGEADRLRRATHTAPRIVGDVRCVYLTARGRCGAYALRPLICRAYGAVQRMSCPHGCMPDRWLSDHEYVALSAEIERLAGAAGITTFDGFEPLPRDEGFVALEAQIADVDGPHFERLAELTRGARALHGGRIVGMVPTPPGQSPEIININEIRKRSRE